MSTLITFAPAGSIIYGVGGTVVSTAPTLTLNTGTGSVGTSLTLTGSVVNDALTALDYTPDGGTTWLAASSLSVSNGSYSALGPAPVSAGTLTIQTRDHNAQGVTSLPENFAISQTAPVETLALSVGNPVNGYPIPLTVVAANGAPAALDYAVSGGAFAPVGSFTSTGNGTYTCTIPAYTAAFSGTVQVRDHAVPTVLSNVVGFSVSGPEALTLTVGAPSPNVPLALTVVATNGTPAALDYTTNAGATWTPTANFVSTGGGTFTCAGPIYSGATTGVIQVRDHTLTSILSNSSSFNVPAPAESITLVVGSGSVNTPLPLSGVISNGVPTALDYSTDGGVTWFAVGNFVDTAGNWTGAGPTFSSAASGTIKVRDHAQTGIVSGSANYSVSATEAITLNVTSTATNTPLALTGQVTGATPTAFDYSTDNGVTWTAVGSFALSGTTWTGTGPTYASTTSGNIIVRDHAAQSIHSTAASFSVSAPGQETITVTVTKAFVGSPLGLSGTVANGTPASLDYSLDGGSTWTPVGSYALSGGNTTYNCTGPTFTSAQSGNIIVRDHANQTVKSSSASFAVTVPQLANSIARFFPNTSNLVSGSATSFNDLSPSNKVATLSQASGQAAPVVNAGYTSFSGPASGQTATTQVLDPGGSVTLAVVARTVDTMADAANTPLFLQNYGTDGSSGGVTGPKELGIVMNSATSAGGRDTYNNSGSAKLIQVNLTETAGIYANWHMFMLVVTVNNDGTATRTFYDLTTGASIVSPTTPARIVNAQKPFVFGGILNPSTGGLADIAYVDVIAGAVQISGASAAGNAADLQAYAQSVLNPLGVTGF